MANVFQPTLQSDVRYDQPVDKPSIFGAILGVAGGLLETAGKAGGSGSGSSFTERKDARDRENLSMFGEEITKLEAYRQENGEAAGQIKERQIAANFAARGINFNEDYKQVYESVTGRPWAGYGYQNEAHVAQTLRDSPEFQSGYLAASFALPQDASEEDKFTYASQFATEVAANDVIMKKNTINGQVQWNNSTQGVYESERERIKAASIGLLTQAVASGQVISSEDFDRTKAIWEQYKAERPRPYGITDDHWKAEGDSRSTVDQAFTNLGTAVGNSAVASRLMEGMAKMAQEGGDPITALAILKAPDVVIANHQGSVQETLAKISKGYNVTVNTSDLFNKITDNGTVPVTELPEGLKKVAEEASPEKVWRGVEAAGTLVTGQPNDLQRPEFRQQFVNQATVLGASMMNTKNTQPLSADFISKSIANPTFINNIKTLESLDSVAGASVKATVLSGINTEIIKQTRMVDSIEQSHYVRWSNGAYEFDPVAFKNAHPGASDATVAGQAENWLRREASREASGVDAPWTVAEQYRKGIDLLQGVKNKLTGDTGPTTNEVNTSAVQFNTPAEVLQDKPFIDAVNQTSTDLGFNPDWLMRAIDFETAGTWSTSVTAPGTGATGLIQFIPSTAKGLGISTAELATMDRVTQMQYVKKYLEPYKGRINNFGDLYMAIHWPKGVGKGDSYVLYSEGTDAYKFNKSLDTNGDGTITRGEAVSSALSRSGGGKVTQMTTGRPLFVDPVTGVPFNSKPTPPEADFDISSAVDSLGGGLQAPPPSAQSLLPEVINAPSAPRSAPPRPIVPSEVVSLIKSLTQRGASAEELSAEIIKYLESKDAATD